jgi:hypothetical protein
MQPEHLAEQMPAPWLVDTDLLLRELERCHELTIQIPISTINATHLGIKTAANAIWDLKQRVRFCLQNRSQAHSATQRAFCEAAATQISQTSDQAHRPPSCGAASQCTSKSLTAGCVSTDR